MSSFRSLKKTNCTEEDILRALATHLIILGEPEKALSFLSDYYKITTPKVRVGVRRNYKIMGCYDLRKKVICVRNSEILRNPFIILHEFYHHLRNLSGKHRGNEKYADKFAIDSIKAYMNGCHEILI